MGLQDEMRLLRLKEIVAKYGWPGRSFVGTEAARTAYLRVTWRQGRSFQRLALEAMKKLPPCEVDNAEFASLNDPVLLAEGKKQIYGMIISVKPDGTYAPDPMEEEANVDKRRAHSDCNPYRVLSEIQLKQS